MSLSVLKPVLELWHSREPRERVLMSLAAVVLVLGTVYAAVLDPALQAAQRLKTDLPAAQRTAQQVQQLAGVLKAQPDSPQYTLNGAAGSMGSIDSVSQTSLQASLAAAGITATVSAAKPWVITVNSATGEALWAWVGQRAVSKTQLKRSASGAWQGELTL